MVAYRITSLVLSVIALAGVASAAITGCQIPKRDETGAVVGVIMARINCNPPVEPGTFGLLISCRAQDVSLT